jgi:hypothetical protein
VEIEELLGELDLMRNMKPHENILNLLGQCTTPGIYTQWYSPKHRTIAPTPNPHVGFFLLASFL